MRDSLRVNWQFGSESPFQARNPESSAPEINSKEFCSNAAVLNWIAWGKSLIMFPVVAAILTNRIGVVDPAKCR